MRSQPFAYYTGRKIGDLCGKFSRQILFPLVMATKMVAAWSADHAGYMTISSPLSPDSGLLLNIPPPHHHLTTPSDRPPCTSMTYPFKYYIKDEDKQYETNNENI